MDKTVIIRDEYGDQTPYQVTSGISLLTNQGTYARFVDTTDANAQTSDILSGKTAYINNEKVTGSMVNNGVITETIATKSETVNIPSGYVSGGTVTIDSTEQDKIVSTNIRSGVTLLGVNGDSNVVNTSDANAIADEIATGRTAYVQGQKIVGNGKIGGIGYPYIAFSGRSLHLSVTTPSWDGLLEYSYDGQSWSTWDGSELLSATLIYLRGTNNTIITNGVAAGQFQLTSLDNITILGNIENLLDYDTVSNGDHPTMGTGAFKYLFKNCKEIAIAPQLSAVTLSPSCYEEMFYGCTSLTVMPLLPATTLTTACYKNMFFGCTSLTGAQLLPATVLATSCYSNMFEGCTALEIPPNLTASTLEDYCYYQMFKDCIMLTNISLIAATTLAEHSCEEMFSGCLGLALSETNTGLYVSTFRIPTEGTGQDATDALTNMFDGTSGTFAGTPNINTIYYWYSLYNEDLNPGFLKFSSAQHTPITIQMTATTGGAKTWDGIIEYSHTGTNGWIEWTGEPITADVIKLRGKNNTIITNNNRGFVFTGDGIEVNGYIDSLLDYESVINSIDPTMASYAFAKLFQHCVNLIKAPTFRWRSQLADHCYYYMFNNCTSLTTPPALPTTILASYCYAYMFNLCQALTSAPTLPAMLLADHCYCNMFLGCTSLTTAPQLPATTLANYCYSGMFSVCTSLITAPQLPAITLVDNCYSSMFYVCSALTSAPTLPAISLADYCYYNMFLGCTSLTTAPQLPAITLTNYCYYGMFQDCTNLSIAPELPALETKTQCYYYMFYHCTSLIEPPALPATSLTSYCYSHMFHNCTNLESLPELPALTLATHCYESMFQNCSKIKISTIKTGIYTQVYRIPPFGSGSTATSALASMFSSTGGTFTSTPSINTNYYTSNSIIKSGSYTEIGLHLTSVFDISLYFIKPSSGNILIDWGDGSSVTTISSSSIHTSTHSYPANIEADYTIRIRSTATNIRSNPWYAGYYGQLGSDTQNSLYGLFIKISTASEEPYKDNPVPYVTSITLGYDVQFNDNTSSTAAKSKIYGNLSGLVSLTGTLTTPWTMTFIPQSAFCNCPLLTKIIISEGTTTIQSGVFAECLSLEEVELPSTLTQFDGNIGIGSPYSFYHTDNLISITCRATEPPTVSTSGLGINSNVIIYVPAQSVATYQAAEGWSAYAEQIQAII